MGYSMGARNTAFLALANPEHVRSAVLGGIGGRLVGGAGLRTDTIAQGLEAPSLAEVADPTAHVFRAFAEQTKSDLRALAACMRGAHQPLEPDALAGMTVPVLVAAGTKDLIAGSPADLAALMPGAQVLAIPDRDHMLAVGDRVFKAGVLKFLAERP
jgi:pimeloyl-ACP methyl ester carboxylesterase